MKYLMLMPVLFIMLIPRGCAHSGGTLYEFKAFEREDGTTTYEPVPIFKVDIDKNTTLKYDRSADGAIKTEFDGKKPGLFDGLAPTIKTND